jgi:hypothetical protein
MGCRERTRGAINIPGFRPAGIYTAGTAQRYVNIEGYMPGKDVVILGSGDIGLIMARRLTLEGAKVRCVVEIMPYSNGLTRNIVQCLEDFDIPLLLSHTVVNIHGKKRVEGVTIGRVDENMKPVLSETHYIPCDTLLLSVGLIPENELSRMAGIEIDGMTSGPRVNQMMETSVEGIFACGNVVHVHDMVDFVTMEARLAGRGAARYLKNQKYRTREMPVVAVKGLRYVLPHAVDPESMLDKGQKFFMRSIKPIDRARLVIKSNKGPVKSRILNYVKPSEMINIEIKKEEISGDDIEYLNFSLEEVGDKDGCQ